MHTKSAFGIHALFLRQLSFCEFLSKGYQDLALDFLFLMELCTWLLHLNTIHQQISEQDDYRPRCIFTIVALIFSSHLED